MVIVTLIFAVLDHEEEGSGTETGSVADLRPVVSKALGYQRHKLFSKCVESLDVLCLLDSDGCLKDSVDDEV